MQFPLLFNNLSSGRPSRFVSCLSFVLPRGPNVTLAVAGWIALVSSFPIILFMVRLRSSVNLKAAASRPPSFVSAPPSLVATGLHLRRVLLRVHLDQIVQDAVGLELLVVHLGPLVGVPAHDGQAVVVGLHHGLVGRHLGQAGDLDEAPGHELAGVDPVVVYSHLPRFGADGLALLGGSFLGLAAPMLGGGRVRSVEDRRTPGPAGLDGRPVQRGGHHGEVVPGRGRGAEGVGLQLDRDDRGGSCGCG
mmetsp:Transcript_15124/g.36123  ORF Transcript_15124/g.36123 Transcript_15124/m.36123 type:complete len:248 (-) Transcript_15124:442-1185(-)